MPIAVCLLRPWTRSLHSLSNFDKLALFIHKSLIMNELCISNAPETYCLLLKKDQNTALFDPKRIYFCACLSSNAACHSVATRCPSMRCSAVSFFSIVAMLFLANSSPFADAKRNHW